MYRLHLVWYFWHYLLFTDNSLPWHFGTVLAPSDLLILGTLYVLYISILYNLDEMFYWDGRWTVPICHPVAKPHWPLNSMYC